MKKKLIQVYIMKLFLFYFVVHNRRFNLFFDNLTWNQLILGYSDTLIMWTVYNCNKCHIQVCKIFLKASLVYLFAVSSNSIPVWGNFKHKKHNLAKQLFHGWWRFGISKWQNWCIRAVLQAALLLRKYVFTKSQALTYKTSKLKL